MKYHIVRIYTGVYKRLKTFTDYTEAAMFMLSCSLQSSAVVMREGATGHRLTYEEIEKKFRNWRSSESLID